MGHVGLHKPSPSCSQDLRAYFCSSVLSALLNISFSPQQAKVGFVYTRFSCPKDTQEMLVEVCSGAKTLQLDACSASKSRLTIVRKIICWLRCIVLRKKHFKWYTRRKQHIFVHQGINNVNDYIKAKVKSLRSKPHALIEF